MATNALRPSSMMVSLASKSSVKITACFSIIGFSGCTLKAGCLPPPLGVVGSCSRLAPARPDEGEGERERERPERDEPAAPRRAIPFDDLGDYIGELR
jgi:hypothetical protein